MTFPVSEACGTTGAEVIRMAYDAAANTLRWFRAALSAPNPRVRWRALELLGEVECPPRAEWIEVALHDHDPRVAATAALVESRLATGDADAGTDLFESDFADGRAEGDLEWEWEYRVVVCRGLYVPSQGVLVWTAEEDDDRARQLALMKACGLTEPRDDVVPIITRKTFVSRYTRSPRSMAEAMLWHSRGRPRYGDRG